MNTTHKAAAILLAVVLGLFVGLSLLQAFAWSFVSGTLSGGNGYKGTPATTRDYLILANALFGLAAYTFFLITVGLQKKKLIILGVAIVGLYLTLYLYLAV